MSTIFVFDTFITSCLPVHFVRNVRQLRQVSKAITQFTPNCAKRGASVTKPVQRPFS